MIEVIVFDTHKNISTDDDDKYVEKFWRHFLNSQPDHTLDLNIPLAEYNASQRLISYGGAKSDMKRRILQFNSNDDLLAFKLRWS